MKLFIPNEPIISTNRVSCLFGFPKQKGYIRTMFLHLTNTGFWLIYKKGKLFIPYEKVISFKPVGMLINYIVVNIQDGFETGIELTYIDNNGSKNLIQLLFFVSVPISMRKNNIALKTMITEMKTNGIFDKFQTKEINTSKNSDDIMKQIENLSELHKSGALTEIEFETKKAELLKRI